MVSLVEKYYLEEDFEDFEPISDLSESDGDEDDATASPRPTVRTLVRSQKLNLESNL